MAATQIRGGQIKDASIALAKLDTSVIDGGGKLLASLLPASIVGAMVYQGAFDASAAAVPAVAAPANLGHYYIVSVAGNGWGLGDWAVSNGATWDMIDNSEATETAGTTSYNNATSGLTATDVQAAIDELDAAIGAIPAANVFTRETPAGAVDGTNADFTLANTPSAGTLQLFLNGQLQEPTDDYTLVGAVATMVSAPLTGDKVRAIYYV